MSRRPRPSQGYYAEGTLPYNTTSSGARLAIATVTAAALMLARVPLGAVMLALLAVDAYCVSQLSSAAPGGTDEAKILLRARWPAVTTLALGTFHLARVVSRRVTLAHALAIGVTLAALSLAIMIMARMPATSGAVVDANLFAFAPKPPALLQLRDGGPVGASGVLWLRSAGIADASWHVGGPIPSYERVWAK
ncbi:uncharacterized protein LOC62_01G001469 [Vanrija pseudolonga]|uniref:Uncharacterized protein n=1 Tax=Vanrija pseudolonga TaxID=143232 RepID=A0AAF0Y0T2_9TREE|nr:hypothetical protein LOC62_01G001469 [Vanrija pseudolonga]